MPSNDAPSTPTDQQWNESVRKAREGNRKALDGRFAVALASFELFAPFGVGYVLDGKGGPALSKTIHDWAEEVGIPQPTINTYRGVVSWWFEGEPLALAEEIGIPTNVGWEALKEARRYWPMADKFRNAIAASEGPSNGHSFSVDDIERLARIKTLSRTNQRQSRQDKEAFDTAIKTVDRTGDRMRRALTEVYDSDLTEEQRDRIRQAALRAKAPLDFLLSYVDGDGTVDDQIAAFLGRARVTE